MRSEGGSTPHTQAMEGSPPCFLSGLVNRVSGPHPTCPPGIANSPPQQLEKHATQGEPVGTAVVGHTLLQDFGGHVPVRAPVGA